MSHRAGSPAEQAAEEAQLAIQACIDAGDSFLVEAGAGSGKTQSLINSLSYVIASRGSELARQHQQVACITYTKVAVAEINSRTGDHPGVHCSTIHSFLWTLIRGFQPFLRAALPTLGSWAERLREVGGIDMRAVTYDEVGRATVDEERASLHHNDVLLLAVRLLAEKKFRTVLVSRHPVLLIDEYQDTDQSVAKALLEHFIEPGEGPLIGFFGDHWQKIYGTGCGKIAHPRLRTITMEANFRSVPVIVSSLNRMRPALQQRVRDPDATGEVSVYHTNDWVGTRRTGQHWSGDLPPGVAGEYLNTLIRRLSSEGWGFSPQETKILMLTHKVLAANQGYDLLADIFPHNEAFIKKEDPYIAFLVDVVEPVCVAYEEKRFGEMFAALGRRAPSVQSRSDKIGWAFDMDTLLELRGTGTIGAVLEHLKVTGRPPIPEVVEQMELPVLQNRLDRAEEEPSSVGRTRRLREVPYQEIVHLSRFIDERTPFSTKHGVKGAEFANVLVVFGRGWNLYDFSRFLEYAPDPPADKQEFWERNRNLFYVTCSRAKRRLALFFTQELSGKAIATLNQWFGPDAVKALPNAP